MWNARSRLYVRLDSEKESCLLEVTWVPLPRQARVAISLVSLMSVSLLSMKRPAASMPASSGKLAKKRAVESTVDTMPASQPVVAKKRAVQSTVDTMPASQPGAKKSKTSNAKKRIIYCSDCSGLDGAALALRSLGVPMQHLFGSEKNKSYRKVLKAFHPDIEHVFQDVSKRSTEDLLNVVPKTSGGQTRLVYTAGWPCQPFSKAGKRAGEADDRSTLVWRVLLTIDTLCPDLVILENTANLTTVKFKTHFEEILRLFRSLQGEKYEVHWEILNSRTIGQVPSSRERVYVVGIRKDRKKLSWTWPSPLPSFGLNTILEPDGVYPKVDMNVLPQTALRNIISVT